ncbi:ATP-binding protein [Lysinibacillus pakistanensis]|uniref:ATP-binding protein n=1 Tax=Lysinibacillus pakistanensis TaxID=759811 RepID=UPI003D2E5EDD
MSKINEIQMKLGELNGGEFQKLMDEYFSKEYKGTLYPIGSVLENNNTKTGTPDTLIKPPSEKYVYIEYTVQKNNVVSKFKEDIFKCFDEKKTGIQKNLIGKIICCCNTRLGTSEIEELVSIGRDNEIVVEVISLDSIAYKLIKFSFLIKDSLGISIDTQQILEKEDFIRINDSARLATPLNIDIFGREDEIESILKVIDEEQIVLISGLPGVGKTRLSLEIMKLFKEQHSEYKLKCLRNNGQNIYDDLNIYFSESGSYLLMIDDANLLTNIQLILDLFSWESKGVKIKLILTVRDYAEEKTIEKINKYNFKTFKIKALTEKHIELLCKHLNVLNTRYIERITEIAKGNPRLAIMGCAIAKKENCLSSLSNVVDIVESYYREIKSYFETDLQNEELLKVGALLSFLNHVNLKDDENLEMLCSVVNQDKETFVKNIYKLHYMEIVDVHENELVKISDQILSIYIFYLSVFKKKDLSYKTLIDKFYPSLKGRIVENLNNVFSYFYKEENLKIVKDAIKEIYEERKHNFEAEEIEVFLTTFWFTLEIEGLIYAKNEIENYEINTIKEISFEIENNNNYSNILKLLGCYNNSQYYMEAIELILLYLEKKPTEFSSVYKILTDNYGFDEKSYIYGYVRELELLKKVQQSYDLKKNDHYTNLLIKFIEYYLRFSYEHTRMKGTRNVTISKIPVYLEFHLPNIRKEIWTKIRELFNQNIYLYDLYKILYNYGRNNFESLDIEVLKFDKVFIESIINDIKVVTLEQSIVFNRLKNIFERNEIHFIEEVEKKIKTKEYLIYKKIFSEPSYNDKDRLTEEKELIDWCTSLVDEDFYEIFRIYNQAISIDYLNSNDYNSGKRLETLLLNISINERLNILESLFEENVKINLHPMNIIKKVKDLNQLEESIINVEFFNKSYWLYCIYKEMSLLNSNSDLLHKIYDYFNQPEGEVAGYSRDITFLKSFIEIDENVFTTVINLLLKQEDIVVLRSLQSFLLHCPENEEYITIYLKNDLNLLKTLYLRFLNIRQHFDYDSSILKIIVRRDSINLKEILESILEDEKTTYKFDEEINFTFIWNEENWFELADLVGEIIEKYTHKKEKYYAVKDLLEKLLHIDSNSSENSKENLYKWIESKIIAWEKEEKLIISLYECLTKFENNTQIEWIINLMKIKPSFEFFKHLPLLPSSYSWSGSEVPVLRERQLFYQQLSDKVEGIQFLEHKQWLNENINYLEEHIKKVKIRELTEDL